MESKKWVLICDDEEPIADLVGTILKKQGLQVTVLYDADQVASALARAPYDLLILDRAMPTKTGDEVLRDLQRGSPTEGRVPVILLTGSPPEFRSPEEAAILDYGPVRILAKPAGEGAITSAVREILGS